MFSGFLRPSVEKTEGLWVWLKEFIQKIIYGLDDYENCCFHSAVMVK